MHCPETTTPAVLDVLNEYASMALREEGTRDGQLADLVGSLLAPERVTGLPKSEDHPRSRLVLCAAFLLAEIERIDRATPTND